MNFVFCTQQFNNKSLLFVVLSVSLKLMALCVRGSKNPEAKNIVAFIANAPNNKSNWPDNGLLQNKVKYTGTEDIKGRRT